VQISDTKNTTIEVCGIFVSEIRTMTYYPCHTSAAADIFLFFFTPHNASPPIQFNRIASAARSFVSPRGSGIKGIANTSPIESCSGYPPIPYLPRSDVRSLR
jgi:hypothetical protein